MAKYNSEQNAKHQDNNTNNGNHTMKLKNVLKSISNKKNIIFMLLFAMMVSIGAYLHLTRNDQILLLQNQVNQITKTSKNIGQEHQKILRQGEFLQLEISAQQNYNKQIDSITTKLKNEIIAIKNVDRTQWILFEAEILINLASQKLKMLQNKQECQQLIETSMDLLRSTNKKITFSIIEKSNEALVILENLDYVDIEDIYLKLNFIQGTIKQLNVAIDIKDININPIQENTKPEPKASGFIQIANQALSSLWHKLANLFIITKRNNNNFTPLLSEQEIHIVKLIIYSNIEQAKIALLSKHQKIFNDSMSNVLTYLQLLTKHPHDKLITEITKLADLQVDETIDNILSPVIDEFAQVNAEIKSNRKVHQQQINKTITPKENN